MQPLEPGGPPPYPAPDVPASLAPEELASRASPPSQVSSPPSRPDASVHRRVRALAPWLRLLGALALVAAIAWLFAGGGLASLLGERQEGRLPAVGARPPTLALPSDHGQTVSLDTFRGQPVVINFWATWCLPCRAEMPELEAAYVAHQARGLAILGVNLGEDRETVLAFRRDLGLTFPLLLDELGRASAEYGVKGLPTTLFIARDGRITHIHFGALSTKTLQEQLSRIL